MYTRVIPILIFINVQYLQNVIFSFEKGSNSQNHSTLGSHQPIKKIPLHKFPIPPSLVGDTSQSLDAIWKTLSRVLKCSKQLKCPSSVSSALKNLMAQKMNDISQFLASLLAGFKGVGVTENFAGGGGGYFYQEVRAWGVILTIPTFFEAKISIL